MGRPVKPWEYDVKRFILDLERRSMPSYARAAWEELYAWMVNTDRSGILVAKLDAMVSFTNSDTYEEGLAALACIAFSGTGDVYIGGYKLEGDVRVTRGVPINELSENCQRIVSVLSAELSANCQHDVIVVCRSMLRDYKRSNYRYLSSISKDVLDIVSGRVIRELSAELSENKQRINSELSAKPSLLLTINPQLPIEFKAQSGVPPSAEKCADIVPASTPTLVLFPASPNGNGNHKPQCAHPDSKDPPPEYPEGLTRFWRHYPLKGRQRSSRAECGPLWHKYGLEPDVESVLGMLERYIQSPSWTKEGGAFIPAAHRWLKNRKYTEVPEDSFAEEDLSR